MTAARLASDSVRMVPAISAVSGITLSVVPAAILAMVTTAGSKTLTSRVTIVWMACTIAHATGIGSSAAAGLDACPPRPVTVMCSVSAAAIAGPRRTATTPDS